MQRTADTGRDVLGIEPGTPVGHRSVPVLSKELKIWINKVKYPEVDFSKIKPQGWKKRHT